jgi:hypothetical protein
MLYAIMFIFILLLIVYTSGDLRWMAFLIAIAYVLYSAPGPTVGGARKDRIASIYAPVVDDYIRHFHIKNLKNTAEIAARASAYHILRTRYNMSEADSNLTTLRGGWLRYNNVDLELDCVNEKSRIAIEVDGPMHYSYRDYCIMNAWKNAVPGEKVYPSSATVLDWYRARRYDMVKQALCRTRGIQLVRVRARDLDELYLDIADGLASILTDGQDYVTYGAAIADYDVIAALNAWDTADSSSYVRVGELQLASTKWHPHPFLNKSSLYHQFWMREFHSLNFSRADFLALSQADLKSVYPAQIELIREAFNNNNH